MSKISDDMHRRHHAERAMSAESEVAAAVVNRILAANEIYDDMNRTLNPPIYVKPTIDWADWWLVGAMRSATPYQRTQRMRLFRMLREPDRFYEFEGGVGPIWIKGDSGATVINADTGATYFDGRRIADDFTAAMALFWKRANRIEYGVDPPPELYEARKRHDRNRRRAATRSRSGPGGAKLLVSCETPELVAVGEKPAAPSPERIMDVIRDIARG